ncbi:MAG: S8 family peptidase [Candidatus Kapabacteria bacterium]|nr:S8 family peptidase [Candidatus Kapabacteria bacterium]
MKHLVHLSVGRKLYKFSIIFVSFTILAMFSYCNVYSQSIPTNVLDSIKGLFPPDSMYVKNEVIIKFKKSGLSLEKLCYSYGVSENISTKNEKKTEKSFTLHPTLEYILSTQRFSVDSLIPNISLRNTMKAFGGDTLRRVTFANPCVDTFSITRMGDTIPCTDFLWMVLQLNNDTSVVNACIFLTYLFQNQIEVVTPNIYFTTTSIEPPPQDGEYGSQMSLHGGFMGMEFVWEKGRVGLPTTLVGILDNGIDYRHCDLGNGNFGSKVVYGWWNQLSTNQVFIDSHHGTSVAGIIGAYSNRITCPTGNGGIAGIAGGWGTFESSPPDNQPPFGVSLLGYKLNDVNQNNLFPLSEVKQAVRHASSNNPNSGYGQGVHIMNNSWGNANNQQYLEWISLGEDINYAFENDVTIVCSRGNLGIDEKTLPANFENHKVISVGGYGFHRDPPNSGTEDLTRKVRHYSSSWGNNMDFLGGPFGACDNSGEKTIYTTGYTGGTNLNNVVCVNGTSFSAPHATGLVALLHSTPGIIYENAGIAQLPPEDYQGLLKVSCIDIDDNETQYGPYTEHYDEKSGWGWLKASKIYQMLQDGYKIHHFSAEDLDTSEDSFPFLGISGLVGFNNNGNYSKILNGKKKVFNSIARRELFHTVVHTERWHTDGNHKIFIWGRSGAHNANTKSGYNITSAGGINYQNGFTGVISGYGGNGKDYNMIHDANVGNHTFEFVTYQYHIDDVLKEHLNESNQDIDIEHGLYLPQNNQIGINYTVFAKPIEITSVIDVNQESSIKYLQTETNLNIKAPKDKSIDKVQLVNVLGDIISSVVFNQLTFQTSINTSILPSGLYFVLIYTNNKVYTHKFSILR